jgi:hypothetical protein
MAINILSILSILAEAKQVFLGARRIVLWDRILLGSTNIKHIEYLKSWLLSNIIAKGRLMAANAVTEALAYLAD